MKSRWAFAVIASLSVGCSAGTEAIAPPDETGGDDTSIATETGNVDTGSLPEDTSIIEDTGTPIDTGTPTDTGSPTDTGTPSDTSMTDTAPVDTGSPMDTAMPTDTSTCSSPSKVCGGSCVNVTADVNNCGDCGTRCPTSGICASSSCFCPVSTTLCGSAPGICTDTKTDNANCGACGNACTAGKVCNMGVCACAPGLVSCTAGCKDLSSDVTACGSCTNTCAAGAACSSGSCVCPTAKPDICSATCVDKKTDNANCGACGVVCATGATCTTTSSVTSCRCPAGQIVCGGKCIDPSSDLGNCGGCGLTCTGGTCAGGTCACPSGKVKCGGACVDVSSDPRNCGGCGVTCGSGTCLSGVCPVPACKGTTTPTKVLFYGPTGSSETPFLPPGAVVTIASDATWRTMTRAQFESFDIIVFGQPASGSGPTFSELQAAFDTRATWGAAIGGRVSVLGVDPGYHSTNAGAVTFGRATFAWLARGPVGKTALYVSSDWDIRNLDFLSPLGTFSASTGSGDTVTVTDLTHASMIGSTSATMSSWGSSFHSQITTFPTTFRSIATGTSFTPTTGSVVVVHDEACTP